jgi:hypothetical protein
VRGKAGVDDSFAESATGAGDVNADGFADVVAGATEFACQGTDCHDGHGYAAVFAGSACPAGYEAYGDGWRGLLGVPELTLSDNPILCQSVTVNVEKSRGSGRPGRSRSWERARRRCRRHGTARCS